MSNAQNILAGLRSIISNVTTVTKVATSRIKRDTLEEARSKVVEKMRNNSDVVQGNVGEEKVDSVYKDQGDGKYSVGIKYGNRYLQKAIAGGTFVTDVERDQLHAVIDELASQVEKGWYDDAIVEVMRANVAARNNAKH